MRSWFACPAARVARWSLRNNRDRESDWAPGLSARGGEFERRIMVRQMTDRIDDWWNRRVPSQDSTRRALVGMSRKESAKKESAKDEAQVKRLGLVPDLILGAPCAASRVEMNAPTKNVGAPLTPRPSRDRRRVP